jgi:hypothetical protein
MPDTHSPSANLQKKGILTSEHVAEAAAIVPLFLLGQRDWNLERTWYDFDTSRAQVPRERVAVEAVVGGAIVSAFQEVLDAFDQTKKDYNEAYYKSRIELVWVGTGDNRRLRPRTKYYWDEELSVPKNHFISNQQLQADKLLVQSVNLQRGNLVSVDKLRDVVITARQGNQTSQRVLTSIIYAGIGASLVGYEEALAYSRIGYNRSFEGELADISSNQQQSRRNFIKFGAALAGFFVAGAINTHTEAKLEAGEKKLKHTLNQQFSKENQAAAKSFEECYGLSPHELESWLEDLKGTVDASLKKGVKNQNVRRSFVSLSNALNKASQAFSELMQNKAEWHEFGKLCASAHVTKILASASTGESRRATFAVVLEGLGVAAAMAAVIVPGEVWNLKNENS